LKVSIIIGSLDPGGKEKEERISAASMGSCGKRDWANLPSDLVEKVASLLLRYDVTEYLRLRAACKAWRMCRGEDPCSLECRFCPHRWIMLSTATECGVPFSTSPPAAAPMLTSWSSPATTSKGTLRASCPSRQVQRRYPPPQSFHKVPHRAPFNHRGSEKCDP
jgi:hypothetical protein